MKQKEKVSVNLMSRLTNFFRNKWHIALVILLIFFIVSRFNDTFTRNPYGWDQVDNAWTAKHLIINHQFPLVGMQAKLNSNIYIGPLYYYYVSFFYFLTNLNPVASGITAGVTAIIAFFVLYVITKKLFSEPVAVAAVAIYTVSIYANDFDRVQWPVNFIMPLSLLVFFYLHQVLLGQTKSILVVAVLIGLLFHVHFTAIFFPLIVLLAIPFYPQNKRNATFNACWFGTFRPYHLTHYLRTILWHIEYQWIIKFDQYVLSRDTYDEDTPVNWGRRN